MRCPPAADATSRCGTLGGDAFASGGNSFCGVSADGGGSGGAAARATAGWLIVAGPAGATDAADAAADKGTAANAHGDRMGGDGAAGATSAAADAAADAVADTAGSAGAVASPPLPGWLIAAEESMVSEVSEAIDSRILDKSLYVPWCNVNCGRMWPQKGLRKKRLCMTVVMLSLIHI